MPKSSFSKRAQQITETPDQARERQIRSLAGRISSAVHNISRDPGYDVVAFDSLDDLMEDFEKMVEQRPPLSSRRIT